MWLPAGPYLLSTFASLDLLSDDILQGNILFGNVLVGNVLFSVRQWPGTCSRVFVGTAACDHPTAGAAPATAGYSLYMLSQVQVIKYLAGSDATAVPAAGHW